ncbi:MAG: bifunctional adenosylcobinamide kinase/adenosylcobinamide-phosphate guanylyltransferase [Dehalococcoidia bacterium]|nr:MAG: bifunctional adenosylcobinamide kinase/adenosylcobinamide-phosphate guanylyltransferase [Dehalococcoidia bacterium]
MAKQCIFILGGARSGKSRYAQELAGKLSNKVLFVATGEARDKEMQARISHHKKNRPESWRTLEAPTNIGRQIEQQIGDAEVVLIDCLTLLVSNLLGDESDYSKAEKQVMAEINELIACMDKLDSSFIIVSNEVSMGLVPETRLGRIYRDMLGKANQLIARHASEVYLMVAGIPVKVKG